MDDTKDNTLLLQLFIFSSILFFALSFSFILKYYKAELSLLKKEFIATAKDAKDGFIFTLTEDLDPDFPGRQ